MQLTIHELTNILESRFQNFNSVLNCAEYILEHDGLEYLTTRIQNKSAHYTEVLDEVLIRVEQLKVQHQENKVNEE
jgi:hypothetical protein